MSMTFLGHNSWERGRELSIKKDLFFAGGIHQAGVTI